MQFGVSNSTIVSVVMLTIVVAGCTAVRTISHVTDPAGTFTSDTNSNQVAKELSGGKIDRYTYLPELPESSEAKSLLQACRYFKLDSHVATSRYLAIEQRGRFTGVTKIEVLVVGNKILMEPADFERFVIGPMGGTSRLDAYPLFATMSPVLLIGGAKSAVVGSVTVALNDEVVQDPPHGTIVMTWSDLSRVVREHDKQFSNYGPTIIGWWLTDKDP